MTARLAGGAGLAMKRRPPRPCWFLAALLLTLAPATAATVALNPVADATLYEESTTTTANGAGEFLLAGRNNQATNSRRRSLLRFDLSSLPAGATITAASLQLSLSTVSTADTSLSLHRATQAWTEGPADPAGNESAGIAATIGDTTWQAASHPVTLWTTPGGDALPTPSATVTVGTTAPFHLWSGPGLVNDIHLWAANPDTNFGWILRDPESTPQTAKRFASREHPDPALRPLLIIEFTPIPEPSAVLLLLTATFTLLLRRRIQYGQGR